MLFTNGSKRYDERVTVLDSGGEKRLTPGAE